MNITLPSRDLSHPRPVAIASEATLPALAGEERQLAETSPIPFSEQRQAETTDTDLDTAASTATLLPEAADGEHKPVATPLSELSEAADQEARPANPPTTPLPELEHEIQELSPDPGSAEQGEAPPSQANQDT